MPADEAGTPTVAITGANGTIGYACVVEALRKNYRVRCIVRREDAFAKIKSGPSIQEFLPLERLEHAVVPDNAAENAYDKALAGATYVLHIAGAWPMPHLHPDNDIYHPFIKSTHNIIDAARKSRSVKRIVFTQAGAGLVDSEAGDTYGTRMQSVLDEHVQINPAALTYRPPLSSAHHAYCAAKAQSMRIVHDLHAANTLPFDMLQILPGTVIGPSDFARTRALARAAMDRQTKALLFNDARPRYAFGFVHVAQCAQMHVAALDEAATGPARGGHMPPWFVAAATSEAGVDGERVWARAVRMVQERFARAVAQGVFEIGVDKAPVNMPYRVDSSMTERLLLGGASIKGLEECVSDVAEWYLALDE
ncbi:hypothetical protein ACEQ8H_007223 [Pleosporales sp. CAS-2024a]